MTQIINRSRLTPAVKQLLSSIGRTSKSILAIAGAVGILFKIIQFIDDPTRNIPLPDITIRPIHEVLASNQLHYSNGSPADYKLMGVEIKNESDISDLKLKLSNISYMEKWSISSTGMSEADAQKLVSQLPIGIVLGKDIYFDMPRIMAKSDTIIQFNGATQADFKPSIEWFNGSSQTHKIYHFMYQEWGVLREYYYATDHLDWYEILFYLLLGCLICVLIYRFLKKETSKKASQMNEPNSDVSSNTEID